MRVGGGVVSIGGMEEIYSFAGNPLDRASERRRDGAWVGSLLDHPAARVLPRRDLRPLTRALTGHDGFAALDWRPLVSLHSPPVQIYSLRDDTQQP